MQSLLLRAPVRRLAAWLLSPRRWRTAPTTSASGGGQRTGYKRQHPVGGNFLGRNFARVSVGRRPPIRPSLPFLPDCDHFDLLDSCNGLLLCLRLETADSFKFDYVVCNPATEKWVALPGFFRNSQTARLGFDPAVSSHFHVFHFLEHEIDGYPDDDDYTSDGHVKGIEIYSSETGSWSHKDSGWGFPTRIVDHSKSAFFNGFLHLLTFEDAVVAVDVEGTTWRVIPIPYNPDAPRDLGIWFTDMSQGRLYFAHTERHAKYKLSIWVLEDYDSQVWVRKHSVRHMKLFGVKYAHHGSDYHIVALHPQRNMIFLVYGHAKEFISYDMDCGKVRPINKLGHDSVEPYLPYVPLYSEELADWH